MLKKFSILLPPPNITGSLHIGHYFNWSIQDFILKHKRSQGYETNWYLGLDHAGIATQYIVEKQLKEEGKTRIELGRNAFNSRILEWKKEAEELIQEQVKNFQFNMQWEKHRFTMDPEHQKTVINSFVKLYEDGLISKQNMITNWDPKFNTAISDLEVIERKEKNKIYKIEYKSTDGGESLFVSTTRPETIFADTALCMNCEDPRREQFSGKKFLIPLINKEIPLIFDELCILNKGEGVLKVTPAHDHLDYEIGIKHNLEIISIISKEGKIYNTNTQIDGLTAAEGKKKILELFNENNINYEEQNWEGIKKYTEKSNVPVETIITEQWFLDVSKMAEQALKESENIKFYPENLRNTFKNWMTKIKPWCISRQLWWGHQIPIWYTKDNTIICAPNKEEAIKKAQDEDIRQDEDVLDTWFSSAFWPNISPDNQVDLLVTGKDIIFFWVARMIMFNLYFNKKLPFTTLYFNGIVRDKNNEKMSKTKGNVINPLEINNKYGQDVLRFTLLKQTNNNKDIKLNEKDLELTRNLITKINNANKFIKEFMSKNYNENVQLDNWIEQKIYESKIFIEQRLDNYDIQKACEEFYDLFWNNFCNWYIEGLKQYPSKKAISFFNEIIKIGFPFLPKTIEKLLNNEKYKLENKETNFNKVIKITKLLRGIKKTCGLKSFYTNFEPKIIQNYIKLTLNNQIKSKIICENEEIFIEQKYINSFSHKLVEEINNLKKTIQTMKSKLDNAKNVPEEIVNEWIEKNKENNKNLKELNSWMNNIS